MRFRARGPVPTSKELVAIDYDDRAARENGLGRWPWDRRVHAKVIEWLREAGASVIVLDVLLDYPSKSIDEDETLVSAAKNAGNVITPLVLQPRRSDGESGAKQLFANGHLIHAVDDGGRGSIPSGGQIILPIQQLVKFSSGLGHINRTLDIDGVLRRIPLFYSVRGGYVPALGLIAAFRHLNVDPRSVRIKRGHSVRFSTRTGRLFDVPIDGLGRTWINYAGLWGQRFLHYPYSWLAARAYSDDQTKFPGWFKDKTVVIGNLTTGSGDQGAVPFEKLFPFPEMHLHVLNMLINEQFLRDPGLLESAATFVVPTTILTAAGILGGSGLIISVFLLTLGGYLAILYYAFVSGVILPGIAPFLALLTALILLMMTRFFIVDREWRRFTAILGACLPPQTVERIQSNPAHAAELIKSRRRELSILFVDLKGFTEYCQRSDPQEVQLILDEYLSAMTDVLRSHGGTIDKYMGDGIMAFFGDADPEGGGIDEEEERVERQAAAAVQAGLNMQKKMTQLNTTWRSQGREPHSIRVGINTGHVTVGKMGTDYLWDYTVIGSEVNKAQRLENDAPPGGLLLAQRTYTLARKQGVIPHELQPFGGRLRGIADKSDYYVVTPELVAEILHEND